MLQAAQNHLNCTSKIKVSKNTACQIKSFALVENMNFEKLKFTKINIKRVSQVFLNP